MYKIQKNEQDWKWLFRYLDQTNKSVETIKKRGIIMFGLARVGKSALYNSIINPQSLVGKQIEANCYYVPATFGGKQINPAARISHRLVSETHLPNMRNITQNNEEIALIDMPRAGQRREESKLLTSYALTKLFENLRDAKFILVMTQSSFLSITDNCFTNTFQEFLCLFNFKEMRPEIREQLFKSVSLVITSVRPALANKLLGQLSLNLKNLKELYNQNQQYIPNFEYCQTLINSLIQSKRVQPFLLAEHGRPPPKSSTFLSSLNNKKWRYCETRKIIKQVEYPYARYFRLYLNPSEQNKIQSLIQTRFNELRHLQSLLDDLILRIKDNICNKNVDIKPILVQIYKKFIQGDYYMDMPRNIASKQFLIKPTVVKDRIQKLLLILNHNKKLKLFYEWRAQMNAAEQIQQQVPNSVYYKDYLLKHFNQGIQHVIDLCCNQDATTIFAQIRHIFNKLFFQASTLDCLRKGQDLRELTLRSILLNNIFQNLFLIRKEDENKMVTDIFKQIYNYNFDTAELSFQEIEDIIAYFFTLEQKYSELDLIQVYNLLYKLKKVKILKFQKEVKLIDREKQILREKLSMLYYATLHIICLQYVQHVSDSERIIKALHFQRTIASDIIKLLLYTMGDPMLDLAHQICQMLRLHRSNSFLFQQQILNRQKQKDARRLNIIKAAAEHQQKIGNTTKCLQLWEKFKKEGGRIQKGIDPIIYVRKNAQYMLDINKKCKLEQERTPLNSQKVFQCLRLCFSRIFNLNIRWQFNIEEIGSAYRAKMAQLNQQGQINKQLLKNPEPIQLIEQCSQMIKICKDKKLTILLGSRRFCGLTTLSYALQKKRLITFEDGKYQLEINSKSSKINHNSSSPNQFPNIFKINEEEWIIDFPNIFPYDPEIALIKANILEKFIRQSSGFRIILVINQEGFLQSQSAQLIRLLKFIMKAFPKNQFKIGRALGFTITMSSTGPEHVKNFRQASKLLLSRFKNLEGNQLRVIENQKKFKLSYAEQIEVNQILKEAISKGARLLIFEKPILGQQQNMTNFLEQVIKNGEYISRQVFMEPYSIKICTIIHEQFLDSESQRIVGIILFLVRQIRNIFNQIANITDKKLVLLIKDRNFPPYQFDPQFDKMQVILNECSKITSKSKKIQTFTQYQIYSEIQKTIIYYREIMQYRIKDIDSYNQIFSLPDDCIPFLDCYEKRAKQVFKKVINFVCSRSEDTVPIVKAQSTIYILIDHLKWLCGALIFSKGQIKEAISSLESISHSFSNIFEVDISDVINSFKEKVKIDSILKLPLNEQKQNALIHYSQIINMISKGQDQQQLSQMKKIANQSLRELYTKNGKSKQLCLIILQQIQQKTNQKLEKLLQMRKLFRSVAENIVLLHPKLGLQICYMSNMPDIGESLCWKIIQYSADLSWKLQAYIELYISLQNRNAEDSAQEIRDQLLLFIGNNHPDYLLLSSPNGIKSKSLRFQTKLKLQLDPKIILSITSHIKQQINTI